MRCGVAADARQLPAAAGRYRGRGQEVLIDLQARRFFCGSPACAKTTFAEQVPGLATRYGRRTCSPQTVLQAVTMALGGRASARLTGRLSCAVSRSTLARLIRAAADPDNGTPLVLGLSTAWPVDADRAASRGQTIVQLVRRVDSTPYRCSGFG